MRARAALVPALIVALAQGCALAPSTGNDSEVEGAAGRLAGLLAGEYTARDGSSAPGAARHELTITRLAGASMDQPVLQLRQFRDGEPVRADRLVLQPGPDATVVQRVLRRNGSGWQALEGCEVHWRPVADGFRGETRGDGCRFRNPRTDGVVTLERRWHATGRRLGLEERYRGDGERGLQLAFERVRWFRGVAGVRARGPDGRGTGEWRVERELRLHDGGALREFPDAAGGELALRLERLDGPGSRVSMLRLEVLDAATGEVMAQAWAPPDAGRIGLHLGWLQVGLEAAPAAGGDTNTDTGDAKR